MTTNTKALILSTLVFPGIGQLFLKHYKTALFFIIVALTAFIVIFTDVMSKATVIANKIVAGEMTADYAAIRNAILEQQANSDSQLITVLTYTLVAIWLASIIHIIFLRKKSHTQQ